MPCLSHSQCETWAQCRKRWYLQKIEGAPQAPSEALVLGSAIHACLEADGRRIMEGKRPETIDILWHEFETALFEQMRTDDPRGMLTRTAIDTMLDKGQAVLEAYVTHLQPRYSPIAVEESFTVDIPGAPGWRFTGRIDARVTMAGGQPGILDFKTGKAWTTGLEHTKAQSAAYLWADAVMSGDAECVVFAIFPVEPDGNGGYTCKPQFRVTERSIAQMQAYEEHLAEVTRQIERAKRSGEFPAKVGPLCGGCGVRGSCEEGRAWAANPGRKVWTPEVSRQKEEGGKSA